MNKRNVLSVIWALLLVVGLAGTHPAVVQGAGFEVDDSGDTADASPGNGTCADASGDCTLRAAIEEANAWAGADTITFGGAMTITISTVLPTINEALTIDASGVWDSLNDQPGVVIDGGGLAAPGLHLNADSCGVYGLHITGFQHAIYVASAHNQIGGTGAGQRNVLSGNNLYGLWIDQATAQYNQVQNNYIGAAPDGVTAEANQYGVAIGNGASYNTIGGSTTAEGNLISGNTNDGVHLYGTGTEGNALGGNVIGFQAGGTLPLSNGGDGVELSTAKDTFIGGGSGLAGNLIGHNVGTGIYLGANITGTTTVEDNVIRANGGSGVEVFGANGQIIGNVITGNLYGVGVNGATATGNVITVNSISQNTLDGISISNGANGGIAAPTIVTATLGSVIVVGTACPGCVVEVFENSDNGGEGETYIGTAIATAGGAFTLTVGSVSDPYLTATATDVVSGTSEFSNSFPTPRLHLYLPLVISDSP